MAAPWAPHWLSRVALVLGAAYLFFIWQDSALARGPASHLLPRPVRFFVEVAELFPRAADDTIEWRARGFRCDLRRFEEIDLRPFFPIRRDDKENRFFRAMFFYRREARVLEAMDAYLTSSQNRLRPEARIGGVMLMSLRVPIPPLGAKEDRYQPLPIDSYPPAVERKWWYVTPAALRNQRCAESP
jgi:hypothetical protein